MTNMEKKLIEDLEKIYQGMVKTHEESVALMTSMLKILYQEANDLKRASFESVEDMRKVSMQYIMDTTQLRQDTLIFMNEFEETIKNRSKS